MSRRGIQLGGVAMLCFAVILASGCARMLGVRPPGERSKPAELEARSDPFNRALQNALVQQQFSRATVDRGYRIGAHDLLEIMVYEYEKLNAVVRVSAEGEITFPPLGNVKAAGLTDQQLQAILEDRLRGDYLRDPHVIVSVKEPHASEVAIVGEIEKPGRYLLLGGMRVTDLLTEAGGLTERAGTEAYLIRFPEIGATAGEDGNATGAIDAMGTTGALTGVPPGGERIEIDLEGLLVRGEEKWNAVLQPGDLVNVMEAGAVHITGPGVEKPGTYDLTRTRNTLRQMLDEAGGLKFEATREFILIRETEAGETESVTIDYGAILKGRRQDIELHSGDMIVVSRRPVLAVLATVGRGLSSLVRFGIYGSWSVPVG